MLGLKIYRNILLKNYKSFPYQKLSGRNTLLYSGKIICNVKSKPDNFDDSKDLYITCDCDFSKWKNIKRIL